LWVRFLTGQKLLELHRRHLGAERRDVRRELPRPTSRVPGASSEALARALSRATTSPSQVIRRAEEVRRLEQALESMNELDREILVLRHFEQLSNAEIARVLELSESAASRRYTRAIERLRRLLGSMYDTSSSIDGPCA
jgi:RNA polymerase sigma-70 factor (ECF subfamily)